jgi:AbrB family looped-hinge helix DNA binding protein
MNLTVDKMGRVVVPKPLRDRFALEPGSELEVVIEADGFRLKPVQRGSSLVEEEGILTCSSEVPPAAWDLARLMEEHRDQRSKEIGGL